MARPARPSRVALRVAWGLGGAVLGMLAFVPVIRVAQVVFGGVAGFTVAFLIALAATK